MGMFEDLVLHFKDLRREALEKVSECARNEALEEVVKYARIAEECEKTLQQVLTLERTAVRIEDLLKSPPQGPMEVPYPIEKNAWLASSAFIIADRAQASEPDGEEQDIALRRLEAKGYKEDWLERLSRQENVELVQVDESRKSFSRTTLGGYRIGIAFANEGKSGEKWFLGLPVDGYDFLILLCRTLDSRILDFVVPVREVSEGRLEDVLSSRKGQYKINVRKKGDGYFLLIPNRGRKSIGEYLGRSDFLKCVVLPEESGKPKGEES